MAISRARKRLNDLFHLIKQAEENYFEPEMFRQNINNAIMISRTVSFLIQKDKALVEDFDQWYDTNFPAEVKNDPRMKWLKDSRNTIEKQGDLEVHSYWKAYHLYSYTEVGQEIEAPDLKSINLKIKSLIAIAKSQLPKGIYDGSAIVVDRKWVANTLPDYEILDTVIFGSKVLQDLVNKWDQKLGIEYEESNLTPDFLYSSQVHRAFIKLDTGKVSHLATIKKRLAVTSDLETKFKSLFNENYAKVFDASLSLENRVIALAEQATKIYHHDKFHVSVVFLINDIKKDIRVLSPEFDDHLDKIIFWHEVAFLSKMYDFTTVFTINEFWTREGGGFPNTKISDLKIIGEGLMISAITKPQEVVLKSYIKNVNTGELELDSSYKTPDSLNIFSPLVKQWSQY